MLQRKVPHPWRTLKSRCTALQIATPPAALSNSCTWAYSPARRRASVQVSRQGRETGRQPRHIWKLATTA